MTEAKQMKDASKISIPKVTVAKHFENHFGTRPLSLSPELENLLTTNYPHLDSMFPMNFIYFSRT